jgi:predicted membrane protein
MNKENKRIANKVGMIFGISSGLFSGICLGLNNNKLPFLIIGGLFTFLIIYGLSYLLTIYGLTYFLMDSLIEIWGE